MRHRAAAFSVRVKDGLVGGDASPPCRFGGILVGLGRTAKPDDAIIHMICSEPLLDLGAIDFGPI